MNQRHLSSLPGYRTHFKSKKRGRKLLERPADYAAFEKILAGAHARTGLCIAAYCLMRHHWHPPPRPKRDGELSEVLRCITGPHTQRWHANQHTVGTGQVYQGRFRSVSVQTVKYFLTVGRYVERMPSGLS